MEIALARQPEFDLDELQEMGFDEVEEFGPDPVLLRKKGESHTITKDISDYKRKIGDEEYLDHAIQRIAMELSHFLSKYKTD